MHSLKVPFSYAILITTILSSPLWTSSPSRAAEKEKFHSSQKLPFSSHGKSRKAGPDTYASAAESSAPWQNSPKERTQPPPSPSSSNSHGKSITWKKEAPPSFQKSPSSSYGKSRKTDIDPQMPVAQSSACWQDSTQYLPEPSSSGSYGKSTDLDFDSPYPEKWNQLSIKSYFDLLQHNTQPTPQLVIDWCKGMFSILTDVSLEKQINQITLSRIFSILGQKSKQKPIKMALKDYFKAKPEFLKEWYSKALNRLNSKNPRDQFNQQELSNIFYGHAQLGQQIRPDFQEAWYADAFKRLKSDQFDPQALANIFYGHAQLGQQMRPDFQEAWYRAALKCLNSENPSNHFNEQALANIFYGHARLGQTMPTGFQEAWYRVALNRLQSPNPRDQFDPQQLCNIFYGHALLQMEIPQDWINPLFNALRTTENIKDMSNIYRGLAYFNRLENLTSDPERKAQYEAFCSKIKNKPSKGSRLQTSVKGILSNLFSDEFREEHWFDSLIAHVDFYSPKQNLVVEVDGPSHFIEKTHRYNAKTLLRNCILEKSEAVKVIHVPYFEWDPLRGDSEKKQYLMRKVRSFDSDFPPESSSSSS